MAKSKKRRKVLVFSIIAVVLLGLTALVIFKKRDIVVTVQTEKVTRRNLTELVLANGQIQPVLQVKISAEVSGEIIDLPVKEGQDGQKGGFAGEDQTGVLHRRRQPGQRQLRVLRGAKAMAEANLRKAEAEFKRNQDLFRNKLVSDSAFDDVQAAYDVAKAQLESAVASGRSRQSRGGQRHGFAGQDDHRGAARRDHQQAEFPPRRTGAGHHPECRHRNHDHRRPQRNGGAGGHRRERRGADRAGAKGAAGGGRLQEPQVHRHRHRDRQLLRRRRAGKRVRQPGGHQVPGAHPHPGKGSLPARHVRHCRDRNLLPHQRAHGALRQRHHPPAQGKGEERRAKLAALADPPGDQLVEIRHQFSRRQSPGTRRRTPMLWPLATNAPAAEATNVAKSDKKSKDASSRSKWSSCWMATT